jgi:aspartyl-tRNA(Asn)/glutamyl-tRNA(Gln) amidotransferase subunit C
MEITPEVVDKVAKLARLEISAEERQVFTTQLSSILNYVDQLTQWNTVGVEPTATVLEQGNVFREDVVRPSLPIDNVLANAPTHEADHFCVPKIIE